jgi:arsenate reductase
MSGRLKVIDLLESERRGVLFISSKNAVRSQMAEGFARYFAPSSITIASAGIEPGEVHPMAVQVMKELQIDISEQRAKALDGMDLTGVAVVISLCPKEEVPALPAHVKHLPIPVAHPKAEHDSEQAQVDDYRRTRDMVREVVSTLL